MPGNHFTARNMGHDVSDQPRLSNGQFTFKDAAYVAGMPAQGQQNALEAPMPVLQSAPLEERMYPASVADIVIKHAHGDHSALEPYSEDPEATVPYYRMGVRELNFLGSDSLYGKRILATDLHFEHMHFVGSDSSNFGLTSSGEFSEPMADLKKYQVEAPKYRKEYIDRARLEVASQWEKSEWETMLNQNYKPPTYSVITRNCQHYFAAVLQQAQKYETREKPLVLP